MSLGEPWLQWQSGHPVTADCVYPGKWHMPMWWGQGRKLAPVTLLITAKQWPAQQHTKYWPTSGTAANKAWPKYTSSFHRYHTHCSELCQEPELCWGKTDCSLEYSWAYAEQTAHSKPNHPCKQARPQAVSQSTYTEKQEEKGLKLRVSNSSSLCQMSGESNYRHSFRPHTKWKQKYSFRPHTKWKQTQYK